MDNLDILVKSLNKVENYSAKYIYKKYIETTTDETATAESKPESNPEATAESTEQTQITFKYSKKPNNVDDYKLYSDTIFDKERKHIIKQNDILTEDLDNMTLADDEYENDPTKFNRRQNNSYPDIKRCSYIRKNKNKLVRCKNSIINDDEDTCSRHEDKPNIYWDSYNELVDKISTE
jgi:hypothetical protein